MYDIIVKGKNFRAFSELEWALPRFGLHLIDAKNHTTHGSNMSGKTSFLDSLFFGLYGWLPKWGGPKGGSPDAVIKRGTKSCTIITELSVGSDRLLITRKRGPASLSLHVNGQEFHGKSDEIQKEIDRRIMSPDRFLIVVYMAQRSAKADRKSFYSMSDADRTEMLSAVSGLQDIDAALEKVKADYGVAEKSLIVLNTSIDMQQARVSEFPALIEAKRQELEKLATDTFSAESLVISAENQLREVTQKSTFEYEQKLKQAQDVFTSETESLNYELELFSNKYRELEDSLKSLPKIEQSLLDAAAAAKDSLSKIKDHNRKSDEIARSNERLQQKISDALEEAENHLNGKCKSCNQDLPTWSREKAASEKVKLATDLEAQLKPVPEKIVEDDSEVKSTEAAIVKRRAELDMKPSQIRTEMSAFKAEISKVKSQIEAASSRLASIKSDALSESNKTINEFKKKLDDAVREHKSLNDKHQMYAKSIDGLISDYDKQKSSLDDLSNKKKEKETELLVLTDLLELFGPKGYRSVYFDSLIDRISDRANEILGLITDDTYSTRLDQVGTDSKGNSKIILKPKVSKGGEDVPDDDLSGGAEDRVRLAYDIAIGDIDADGAPLFLDEALAFIDASGKAEILPLLEELAKTRPVYVIDHTSETKSIFSNIITIDHKNGNSSVRSEDRPKAFDSFIKATDGKMARNTSEA